MRRRSLAAPCLAGSLALAAALPNAAAAPVEWEVQLLEADVVRMDTPFAEQLTDLGGDPLERRLMVQQGLLLANVAGPAVGRTRSLVTELRTAELEESFTIGGEEGAPGLEVSARWNEATHGRLVADLTLTTPDGVQHRRSVPLSPHRSRLWLVPGERRAHGVLLAARQPGTFEAVLSPEETVAVELALVSGRWRAGADPAGLAEQDLATWVDPFELVPGESVEALLRPLASGVIDSGSLVARRSLHMGYGQVAALELGRRPEPDGAETGESFLGLTARVVRAPKGEGGLAATLSLQASRLGEPALVVMRRMELEPGGLHVWLLPADEEVHAVFVRARPGLPRPAQAVHPGRGGS